MRSDRLRLALRMVWRRPLRSFMAALGLALAMAATLVAVAIAQKGMDRTLAEINAIGANVLTISAQPSRNRGGRVRTGSEVTTLTLADARLIERQVPGVIGIAAEYRGEVPVKFGTLARQPRVAGIEPSYAQVREAALRAGRFFDASEDAQGARVAVLGGRIANDLLRGADPVGQIIRLGGMSFTVIGVLPERGSGLDAFNEDETIYIPLKTARRRLFQAAHVQRIYVRVGAGATLDDAAGAAVMLLRQRRRAIDSAAPDFRVQDQTRLVALRNTTLRRLRAFQIEVSAALLVAGALGVFALQLLSVRERRAEIGTRRALGATRPMIFRQFVIEAAVVCVAGALAGLAFAALGAALSDTQLSPALSLLASLAFCVAGVVSGAAPARIAAALHPAVALRAQ